MRHKVKSGSFKDWMDKSEFIEEREELFDVTARVKAIIKIQLWGGVFKKEIKSH